MISLHAFVDDSASDLGDRRLFLAAYINGAGPWITFGYDWRDALRETPAIAYLKMSEAQNLSGQFRGWSAANRDAKVLRLANVIAKSRSWSVHCSISRADYARIVAPVAPYPLKNPYFCCFWGIIRTMADYHLQLDRDRGPNTIAVPELDFVFDEQGGLGADAALWYQWLKGDQEPEIAAMMGQEPIFGDDKKMVGLQAADMLAWHLRRRHERPNEPLPILDMISDHGAFREIPLAMLEQWGRKFRRVPGIKRVQTKQDWREGRDVVRAMVAMGALRPRSDFAFLLRMSIRTKISKIRPRWRRFRDRVARWMAK